MDAETFVLAGGGLAAAKAAEALRARGFDGRLVLVGAEDHPPYQRPPLSKGYLLGSPKRRMTFVHAPQWYIEHRVDLRLGTTVTGVDLDGHRLATSAGPVHYDRLLVATGSTPRRLALTEGLDGLDSPVVHLRTIEDSRRIKDRLRPGRRVVTIGGGWIGLEIAAAARAAGCDVVVLEALDLPLVRILGPEVAEVFRAVHESHGVDLRTNVSVTSVDAHGDQVVVGLADLPPVTADLLVVGVGAEPDAAVARAAGLDTDNGIVVDEHLRTSHPDVFAAGDVANAYHPFLQRHLRVEHWDNALHQGVVAAHNMLGADEVYDRMPYFFTDQFDLGVEYVGNVGPDGYDEVILRGDPSARVFTALWLRDRRVVAGMHVNDWEAIDPLRHLLTAGEVDPQQLRDTAVPLAALCFGPG